MKSFHQHRWPMQLWRAIQFLIFLLSLYQVNETWCHFVYIIYCPSLLQLAVYSNAAGKENLAGVAFFCVWMLPICNWPATVKSKTAFIMFGLHMSLYTRQDMDNNDFHYTCIQSHTRYYYLLYFCHRFCMFVLFVWYHCWGKFFLYILTLISVT